MHALPTRGQLSRGFPHMPIAVVTPKQHAAGLGVKARQFVPLLLWQFKGRMWHVRTCLGLYRPLQLPTGVADLLT